jgi:hypothetical protein
MRKGIFDFGFIGSLLVILIALFLIYMFIGLVSSVFIGYNFDREIGQWFELSDKASTIDKKLDYIEKFDAAIQKYDLTEGQTTIFFPTRETSLEENYAILLTLEQRLNETANLSTSSQEYQWAIRQITEDEYCWFHIQLFKQGFYLKNGVWWLALFPSSNENRCAEKRSS